VLIIPALRRGDALDVLVTDLIMPEIIRLTSSAKLGNLARQSGTKKLTRMPRERIYKQRRMNTNHHRAPALRGSELWTGSW
jgi:hypothetical protein